MMDGRSIHEGSCDMVWYTNLKLLGYKEAKFTMFDHSNPPGFQQVFHFLLQLINKDKSNQEFRDCWPILDKKQEADFRRRVSSMIKELQKDHPDELPYCNPSLFQQPGGRKFISFLSKFTTFVLICLVRSDEILLKTCPKRPIIRKLCFKNLVNQTQRIYEKAFNDQEEIEDIEEEAVETVGTILEKYEQHKLRLQELPDEDVDTPDDPAPDLTGKKDHLLETEERARQLFQSISESFETINFVVEGGVDKMKLDFNELKGIHGDGNSLATVYQALIKTALTTAEMTSAEKTPILIDHNCNVETERETLSRLKKGLEKAHEESKEVVNDLQASSLAIDWSQGPLVKRTEAKESVQLLPPTPSIVTNIRSREEGPGAEACRHLNLSSPDPRLLTPRPGLRPGLDAASAVTPVRSAPSATLFRRFPLPQGVIDSPKTDHFTSPQLKLKSPNLTSQSQDLNFSSRTTKGSLGQFSPMLSSTAAVSEERPVTPTFSDLGDITANTPTFSELADNTSRMSTFDTTQSKIDMYRRVLDGLKTSSVSQDKSVLLSKWTAHRESLSPRTTKLRRSRSPLVSQESETLSTPVTPVTVRKQTDVETPAPVNKSPLNDLVISRLDQLMTSLTLNENNIGLNLSLDDEMDLLSPHL